MGRENAFNLLFVALFCITLLTLVLVQYDITHPCSIVSGVMTGSAFCAIVLTGKWNLYMSVNAAFVVILSVLVFVISGIWANVVTKNKLFLLEFGKFCIGHYNIDNKWIGLFAVIILFFTYSQFQEINEIALSLENEKDYTQMLSIVRKHIAIVNFSRWKNYQNILIAAILYNSLFVGLSNLMDVKKAAGWKDNLQRNWKYFVIIVLCFPSFALSTGREKLVELFLFMVVMGSILYQKKNIFDAKCQKKMFLMVIIVGGLFIVLFSVFKSIIVGAGVRLGDPIDRFITYMGISMPAFSYFIDNQALLEIPYIGGTTLIGIYRNLSQLGWALPKPPVFLDFVQLDLDGGNFSANVYTMMYRYIIDYGYVGNYLLMAIMGVFYTAFYNYVRFNTKSFWLLIFYASLMMPLFLSMFDERFLSVVLSTATIYKAMAIYLVCRFCVTREENMPAD